VCCVCVCVCVLCKTCIVSITNACYIVLTLAHSSRRVALLDELLRRSDVPPTAIPGIESALETAVAASEGEDTDTVQIFDFLACCPAACVELVRARQTGDDGEGELFSDDDDEGS
jgi:hypothetical protein